MNRKREDSPARARCVPRAAWAILALLGGFLTALAQSPTLPAPTLPAPTPLPQAEVPALQPPWLERAMPIDLPTALRLAQTTNLDVARAREVVAQTQAQLSRARSLLLPNYNYGTTYLDHEGHLQQQGGDILNRNRTSLWVGGGPGIQLPLAEVIFTPLAARQVVAASEANVQRVTNDTLLAVADTYVAVLRARRRLAALAEALEQLTAPRPAPVRGQSKGLLPMVRDFVEVGGKEALRADVYRVEVEVYRRRNDVSQALQDMRVAMAELARLLHLDPEVPLLPLEDFRQAVPLPGEQWAELAPEALVAYALNNRPELAENQALIQAAVARVRAAKFRPFLPTLGANFVDGWFGGSPVIIGRRNGVDILGHSGRIDSFGHRSDLELNAVYQLRGLGFGNRAEVFEQKALQEQALIRQLQLQDQVIAQVVQAQTQVLSSQERLNLLRASLFGDAGGENGPAFQSLRLSLERIRQGEGRPLEALDSVRGLLDLLDAYGQALTEYERSRFRLLTALGVPGHALPEQEHPPPGVENGAPHPERGASAP
jgi:outer membrane protein TolC